MKADAGRKGFTLVELLTVIAIIALLAAMLFPVFSRARAKSQQTTCLSNLSQLGKAFGMYMQDSGGFVPTWCLVNNSPANPPADTMAPTALTWDVTLMPYIRNAEIVKCASNPNPIGRRARAYSIAQYTQRRVDGQINAGWAALRGVYQDEIPAPSRTVLLFEKGDGEPGSWGDALGQNVYETHEHKTSEDYPSDASWSEAMFHFDGKNILYLDGHAQFAIKGQYPFSHKSARGGSLTGTVWVAGRQTDGGDWPDRD
jgi:prepilin-type N-terminal cleavage/methylation domain-containing protein/prepilin-type processing-associated H-X9-DG protein